MQPKNFRLSVIGAGNMGSALLGGVLSACLTSADNSVVCDIDNTRLERLTEQYGVQTSADAGEAAAQADVVLLAVKPQNLGDVSAVLRESLKEGQLVISILAGKPVQALREALGDQAVIVRVMPNLPALIGCGVSAVAEDDIDPAYLELTESILSTVGHVVRLPENLMDAVTALSGSGPGFVYLLVEAMAEAGAHVGIPRQEARSLARQTFIGACRLMEESKETPEELRRRVTSPGGTTEAGICSFEEQDIRQVFKKALEHSTSRARELGKG